MKSCYPLIALLCGNNIVIDKGQRFDMCAGYPDQRCAYESHGDFIVLIKGGYSAETAELPPVSMLKIYLMAEMAARTKSESLNMSHLTMIHKIHSGK